MRELERELVEDQWPSIRIHYALLQKVEAEIVAGAGSEYMPDHANLLKSAFVLHLYNVIEATMKRTTERLALHASQSRMSDWDDGFLEAWVDSETEGARGNRDRKDRITRTVRLLDTMAERAAVKDAYLGNLATGNWGAVQITQLASRVGCNLVIPKVVVNRATERHFTDRKNALQYLVTSRNALSHGEQSFLDVVKALPVNRVGILACTVIVFLRHVCRSFDGFIESRDYLRVEAR